MTHERLELTALLALATAEAAYFQGKLTMARIDELEKGFNRLRDDTTAAGVTLRSQAAEIKALQDAAAAGETVPADRFDALIKSVNDTADSLEAMGTAGPANPTPVPVPPAVTAPPAP